MLFVKDKEDTFKRAVDALDWSAISVLNDGADLTEYTKLAIVREICDAYELGLKKGAVWCAAVAVGCAIACKGTFYLLQKCKNKNNLKPKQED